MTRSITAQFVERWSLVAALGGPFAYIPRQLFPAVVKS
jgi:hypothetical protein